ncbi:ElyC/SanA/YdcF family protein [Halomonas sp. GT]|uniref:ElyC/SanA/YdcF family protein n=1 Tax=Halomonas sp. GT TaxID=1971364 RepID=UPI001E2A3145|nr:ElyC/SanA/YdcF family protein [Halomonas sp. GT]
MALMTITFVTGCVVRKLGRHRLGNHLIVVSMVLLLLAAWAPVSDNLLKPLETQYGALKAWPENTAIDAVVVLGGGWQPDQPWSITGKLGDSSGLRLMEGLRLWYLRPALPLIVSGSGTNSEMTIAHGYAEAAESLGVPPGRIVKLVLPKDTAEEARAVRALLGEGAHIVLVTSASHMPRAMQHFEQVGLYPVAAPTHYLVGHRQGVAYWIPSARELRKTERAIYEALGLLAIRWEH